MSTYRYAAYGSNLHRRRLGKRVPSALQLGTCYLDGWSLRFNKRGYLDGSGKCNIVEGESGVYLSIYEIDLVEKKLLDQCEGLGSGYDEETISAPGFGDCLVYVAEDTAIDDKLKPLDWYKELVIAGCNANGFPAGYVQAIEAVTAIPDTDEERSREQWAIVDELRSDH